MREGVCGECGGPLYRRKCLSAHARPNRRQTPRAENRRPESIAEPVGSGCAELRWERSFTNSVGMPTSVAVWRAVRVTPLGHVVEVWRAGRRYPADWERRVS